MGFLITAKRTLIIWRKNAQQTFLPFAGTFEDIIPVDYPYQFIKALPKKREDKCRQNRSHRQHIHAHKD